MKEVSENPTILQTEIIIHFLLHFKAHTALFL